MKFVPLGVLLSGFFLFSAEAQVKRGGIFGFSRSSDQISAGLFPENNRNPVITTSAPVSSSPAPASAPPVAPQPVRDSDNIFRGGNPQPVEDVAYTIDNGQRVDAKVKRKKGLFAFGKKEKGEPAPGVSDDSILAPSYPDPVLAPDPAPSKPAPIPASAATPISHVPEETLVDSPAIAGIEEKKKESKRFFPFFPKKEKKHHEIHTHEDPIVTPAPVVAEAAAPDPVTAPIASSTPAPQPKPIVQNPEPAPKPETTSPTIPEPASRPPSPPASNPVPQFAGTEKPKKERDGFSIPNPIAKIKAPKIVPPKRQKQIDLTNAETIIADGEIVAEEEDIVETNIVSNSDGVRQPPRMVNGVKTYSSWDDVEARTVSAADKILRSIR
jgi:hypothetical protein